MLITEVLCRGHRETWSRSRHKWTHPARQAGTRCARGMDLADWLPAHRRSPIQMLTQQSTAGSLNRSLLITSPTP